jgi:hypothetical protein
MNSPSSSITGAPSASEGRLNQFDQRDPRICFSLAIALAVESAGCPGIRVVAVRTWKSMIADRLFGHAAELGFTSSSRSFQRF